MTMPGQLALGRKGEHALMAGAVLADQPRPIDRDHDRQVVLADVVDLLVEGPLQERRVEGHDRPLAGQGHARRERHGMLLGDPDVDEAVRELCLEQVQAGSGRHARGDGDDAPVRGAPARSARGRSDRCSWAAGCAAALRAASEGVPMSAASGGRVAVAGGLHRGLVEAARDRHRALLAGQRRAGQGWCDAGSACAGGAGCSGSSVIGGSAAPWKPIWSRSAGR